MKRKLMVVLCLFVFSIGLFAEEGYDPLIQITHQFAKPNMLIVLDVSGSMAWDMAGNDVGVDSTGKYPGWNVGRAQTVSPCNTQYRYIATLVPSGKNPSRMATVKNALGNSVTLTDFDPASVSVETWQSIPLNSGWHWQGMSGANPQWYYCSNSKYSPNSRPFTITDSCPGYIHYPPKDLIGQTKNSVNWALVIFSGSYGNCSKATVKTIFDPSESGDVSAIENLLVTGSNGLPATGYTPTKGAMVFAKEFITKSILGQTITDYKSQSYPLTRDNKFFACNRTYGVILITDGLSNSCNINDKNWIKPCCADSTTWNCTNYPQYNCDVGSSGYDCDRRSGNSRNFSSFPPGAINDLYLTTISDGGKTYRPGIKTWAIGVSPSVCPCEINFDAYMGRTDASSPTGDAGFDTSKDLGRLPKMNTYTETDTDPFPGKIHYTTLQENEETNSNYNRNDPRTTGQHYGYFADSAEDLANAFASIVAGVATGDYTTSSPVASPMSTSTSNQAFLASAEFPSWNGHVYCYDTTGNNSVFIYDVGEKLKAQPSSNRRIYTWDSSGQLVSVEAGNINQLKTIAQSFTPSFDPANLTTQVVDFIRGNDGNGVPRSWKLGGIINSTPTIVTPPELYKQETVDNSHNVFAALYSARKPLMYVGSDDGMLHCFLITDESEGGTRPYFSEGYELFAIIPPNLLAVQSTLYQNFVNTGVVTGQAKQPKDHIYGVANSVRYGDVHLGGGVWKTVLFLTEGPGGEMLAALDVTDPLGNLLKTPTPDPPTSVLWYHTPLTCPGLKRSWSIPAIASVNSTEMIGILGNGYDALNNVTTPQVIVFDPKDGSILDTENISAAAGTTWVRNQSFADSILLQTQIAKYSSDNLADIGIQADLHGRLWFYDNSAKSLFGNIDASNKAGNSQPIYYAPAVSGYKVSDSKTYDIYVFASGTPYEKDPDVTGPNVGKTTGSPKPFMPSIYIAIQSPWQKNPPVAANITQIPIQNLTWVDSNGTSHNFGRRAQVTSSPLMVIPETSAGSAKPTALFSIYDPDTTDCAGTSYVVVLTIDISDTGSVTVSHSGYSAGSGAASGFAILGTSVVVAKSGIGEGQRATVSKVPGVTPTWNTGRPAPVLWRELQ